VDIQQKLKDLKEMHDKGLVTAAVYEEQQKALLASDAKSSPAPSPNSQSSFFDLKKNMSVLAKLLVLVLIVLGGIWFFYNLSDQGGKDAIGQFASQTGIGAQVIPWADRADTAVRKLIERNKQKIAEAIQGITHPTGNNPVLTDLSISKFSDRVLVEMVVEWKGGILGTQYSTSVAWEIDKKNHINAKVIADSAALGVEARNKDALNEYFRTKVYPAFYGDMGG
jgi:hypothetical protein